jgi:hypothetical protein
MASLPSRLRLGNNDDQASATASHKSLCLAGFNVILQRRNKQKLETAKAKLDGLGWNVWAAWL